MEVVKAITWEGGPDGYLRLFDQTRLPEDVHFMACRTVESVHEAIRSLRVRGAPAIGVAAAYGILVGIGEARPESVEALREVVSDTADRLRTSRPTAVNLFWALSRMERVAEELGEDIELEDAIARLFEEARAIHAEDETTCRALGVQGQTVVPERASILTHCNAGALATGGVGTALAVIYQAVEEGKEVSVFVDETRPLLQGARLTAWELSRAGIPATLLCDNAAGSLFQSGKVDLVIVGADRIARNGDVANKIGTYPLSVLAKNHGIPFYVAAPLSTFDRERGEGSAIPIEERGAQEVTHVGETTVAPVGIKTYNPAFDVTPAENITALITPEGIIESPNRERVDAFLAASASGQKD